jgi:uncharacterized protein (TIGR02444 family)
MMASAEPAGAQKTSSPFWTFSLKIYGMPGVPAACLALQDGSGAAVDVNVLLYALYCARQGRQLGLDDVGRIVACAEAWRVGIVVPLRSARRALKDPPAGFDTPEVAALRQRVKAVELEAERLQQETLYAGVPVRTIGTFADPDEAAPANIAAYALALGSDFDPSAVRTILDAFQSLKD